MSRRYAEQFGAKAAWVRTLPCIVCRRPATPEAPNTSSHVKGRGAGGKSDQQVPMCPECHQEYEGRKREWNARYRLPEVARELELIWREYEEVGGHPEEEVAPGD